MPDENTAEATGQRAADKPKVWHRWSRRATAYVAGGAAVLAAAGATAVVVSSNSDGSPAPVGLSTSSTPAARTQADALDAIVAPGADIRRPVAQLVKQGRLPKPAYAGDTGTVGVPRGVKAPTQAAAGTVPQYVAGPLTGSFSLVQLAALALQAGCAADQAPIAAAIAAAESGGNPGAQGDISLMDGTWDWSEGLWQIRGLRSERGTGALRDSLGNADPATNAAAMMAISSGCTNWTPWSTFNTGAYLSYLGLSKTAAAAATKYHDVTGQYPPIGGGSTAAVPVATAVSTPARRPASTKADPRPKPTGRHRPRPKPTHRSSIPTRSSTSTPAPGSSAHPAPKPSLSLPISLPKSLPIPLPTSSLPLKLPTALPTLPTTLPVPLPSVTLPKLPLP